MTIASNFSDQSSMFIVHAAHHNDLANAVNDLVTTVSNIDVAALTLKVSKIGDTMSGPLDVTSQVNTYVATETTTAFSTRVIGDSDSRLKVTGDGKMLWGLGGGAHDVNLFRSADNTLSTDDSLIVGVDLSVGGNLTITGTTTGLTKTSVGLPLVDNTADTSKPVSTVQQTALNLKANLASPTFTGTVTLPALKYQTVKVTGAYTVLLTDRVILTNSVNPFIVTLPSAVTAGNGAVFTVKNISTGLITMGATAGTIDGAVASAYTIAQWVSKTFLSDGANWFVM